MARTTVSGRPGTRPASASTVRLAADGNGLPGHRARDGRSARRARRRPAIRPLTITRHPFVRNAARRSTARLPTRATACWRPTTPRSRPDLETRPQCSCAGTTRRRPPGHPGCRPGSRHGRRARFRQPVRATHRAPRARAERLLRAAAAIRLQWRRSSVAAPGRSILSGGPNSVYDPGAPKPDSAIWSGRIPVLGICYGAHPTALELGGDVLPSSKARVRPGDHDHHRR